MDEHAVRSPAAMAADRIAGGGERPEPTVPFPRSYWVAPNWLLAGVYPGDRDPGWCRRKLRMLADHGVRTIVNLMEEVEYGHDGLPLAPYEAPLAEVAAERGLGLSLQRYAIRDMGTPSVRRMDEILCGIDEEHAAGRPVYVHCWGGRGRTGTVVGCWLARHRVATGEAALQAVQRLRSAVPDSNLSSPETEEQRRMVLEWRARGDLNG